MEGQGTGSDGRRKEEKVDQGAVDTVFAIACFLVYDLDFETNENFKAWTREAADATSFLVRGYVG